MGSALKSGPAAEELLVALLPRVTDLDITRIADLTGLDRLGVPVVQVVRPTSLSNCVSQGKGDTMSDAALSAILECAEAFFAEKIERYHPEFVSANSLAISADYYRFHLMESAAADWRNVALPWIGAVDIARDESVLVPFELVHTAYELPVLAHEGLFNSTSSGLAVAANRDDALLHAVLECIERDAIARAMRTHGFFQTARIDLSQVQDDRFRELLERIEGSGLTVAVWQAASPTGLPVAWCHLMEDHRSSDCLLSGPSDGSAVDFDPGAAIIRAVREAAQSRLAAISGAREDLTRAFYPKYPDFRALTAHLSLLQDGPQPIHPLKLPVHTPARLQRIAYVVDRLEAAGLGPALAVLLDTAPLDFLSAVRVVTPRLNPVESE
jgi:ribosomal protein S12 methylthiotransferase accessory factor